MSACRQAFAVGGAARLTEAMYACDLQCHQDKVGQLFAVLGKRRGRVVQEELVEGTPIFVIHALLPVVESFGFAAELLSKTSGAATSPQLRFSHWEQIEEDPFFQPKTEEEREELGEVVYEQNLSRRLVDAVRKRKGIAVDEKIVVHAEKQRNRARKK